ncbi:MAG TPA: aldo/keto reductase [Flavitalea sp.]|nr:aldo/keto reductase [Flavitalea sp.]
MHYNQLGDSNLHISEIGFGCMSLSGTDNENATILHRAIDLGINFFDTADLYNKGMNEISVGKALKDKQSKIILATKAGNQWRTDGSGWDWNPRKDYILTAAEQSLKRLQTDCIDLYQLHGGTIDDPIDESIEAFEQLKQQGKIRYYGISSIRPNVIREYLKRSSIVSVMMQYSVLDRRPEESCLDLLKQNNVGVLARGSIAQGVLVNKPGKEYLQHTRQDVAKAVETVRLMSNNKRSATQTSLRYVLNHPAITSAVLGIRTIEQLEEAVSTVFTPELSEKDVKVLRSSIRAITYEQHR